MRWNIEELFELVVTRRGSDVVLVPGGLPVIWITGRMTPICDEVIEPKHTEDMFLPLLTAVQRARLDETGDVDFSMGKANVGRFRINMHRQRGSLAVAIRFIPYDVPCFERLKLPAKVLELAKLPRGLVLVTGGAGTGKSTTLASMIHNINETSAMHVITLEDPVEFTFKHGQSIIEQREIGVDCASFGSALRHVVRQRPDVILVGEMRDLETISAALTAAETGHLVMASLHTVGAVETINRIVDVFPGPQQSQVRVQLADSIQGVVSQTLFHDQLDDTMVPAVELMIATPAIRRMIRDNESHLLAGMIDTGRNLGMQNMDASIAELVKKGSISPGEALAKCHNPEKLSRMIAA